MLDYYYPVYMYNMKYDLGSIIPLKLNFKVIQEKIEFINNIYNNTKY